jgi:cytochrome c-type biogenesis protein CcmH/NrfG
MTTEQWRIQAIEYFNGSMTAEEARMFETETAKSEELTELMNLWKLTDVEASIYETYKTEADDLRATHARIRKELAGKQTAPVRKLMPWKMLAAAAVLACIIFAGYYMLNNADKQHTPIVQRTTNNSSDKIDATPPANNSNSASPSEKNHVEDLQILYANNFKPDKIPDDPNGPLDDAYFYYASHQYRKAIRAIDSLSKKQVTRGADALNSSVKLDGDYYKALSLMSIGKAEAGIPLLKQVATANSHQLKIKAQWYLALAYLKQNDPTAAKEALEKLISIKANPYKDRALNIIDRLK